jgi:FkbM family methyltransferase
MLNYGNEQLRAYEWRGIKPLVARLVLHPLVNPIVLALAKRILPAASLHRLPVAKEHVELQTSDGHILRLAEPAADQFAKDIFWGRGRPTSRADDLTFTLVEVLAKEASTFLDVGAYSGIYAMLAAHANPNLRAFTYEILPENQRLIERNISANQLSGQITAMLKGLSNTEESILMPSNTGSISHPSSLSIGSRFASGVEVPLTTLDAEGHVGPMVIKIDVEGFEWNVFQGGVETIRSQRPDIICEFLPMATEHRHVQELLQPLGYRFFLTLDEGFKECGEIIPDPHAWNWVLSTRRALPHLPPRGLNGGRTNAQ